MDDRVLPLPILSHMPPHVKQQIAENLPHRAKFQLRQCSKQLRDAVDNMVTHYGQIYITFYQTEVQIVSPLGSVFHYQAHAEGYKIRRKGHHVDNRVVREIGSFVDGVISFLELIFKNSRNSVKHLEISFDRSLMLTENYEPLKTKFMEKMGQWRSRTPYLLSIRCFALQMKLNDSAVLTLLQYCQPGTLRVIDLFNPCRDLNQPADVLPHEVAECDQWKQAKKLSDYDLMIDLPYEKWAHLQVSAPIIPYLPFQDFMSIIQNFKAKTEWRNVMLVFVEQNPEINTYLQSLPQFYRGSNVDRRIDIPGSESRVIKVQLMDNGFRMMKVKKIFHFD